MQFLYPQFLWALAALSVPLIIHLFNFRRYKKIFFTNVRFLQHIEQEHRSRNKLRNLLLLLARLLALACIVVAFAYPFIPHQNAQLAPGRKFISVYVDNSFSMSNEGPEGELLETAKKQAETIARQYSEGDAYQLVTNDFELKNQRWLSRQEFLDAIQEVYISPVSRELEGVFSRMRENFRVAETNNKLAYFLSDFQKSSFSGAEPLEKEDIQLVMLPVKAAVESNLYIDSAWFENPVLQMGQANLIKVKIINSSSERVENGTATLTINGVQKAIGSYNIEANSTEIVEMNFTVTEPGENRGLIEVNDYPVSFDNTLYFTFTVKEEIPALIINEGSSNSFLIKAFAAEPAFKVTEVNLGSLDYSSIKKYSFLVLNEVRDISSGLAAAIEDVVASGNNVLLIPPADKINTDSYNALLARLQAFRLSNINEQELKLQSIDASKPFFAQVFDDAPKNIAMPSVRKYYGIQQTSSTRGNVLLQMANGEPFLVVSPAGAGNLYLTAVPFNEEWSSYIHNSLFLPVLYKMALFKNQSEKLYFVIGKDNYIRVPYETDDKERIVKLVKDSLEMIPPQRVLQNRLNLFVENLIPEAGYYSLKTDENSPAINYAFNYDRNESVMNFLSGEQIRAVFGDNTLKLIEVNEASLTHQVREVDEGTQLWKWFIVAALLFLLTETLLIRFWK